MDVHPTKFDNHSFWPIQSSISYNKDLKIKSECFRVRLQGSYVFNKSWSTWENPHGKSTFRPSPPATAPRSAPAAPATLRRRRRGPRRGARGAAPAVAAADDAAPRAGGAGWPRSVFWGWRWKDGITMEHVDFIGFLWDFIWDFMEF